MTFWAILNNGTFQFKASNGFFCGEYRKIGQLLISASGHTEQEVRSWDVTEADAAARVGKDNKDPYQMILHAPPCMQSSSINIKI